METDTRRRILREIALLRNDIATCARCEALQGQILNLLATLPPEDPILEARQQLLMHRGKWWEEPEELWRMVAAGLTWREE